MTFIIYIILNTCNKKTKIQYYLWQKNLNNNNLLHDDGDDDDIRMIGKIII
jgi:hypothetical protein